MSATDVDAHLLGQYTLDIMEQVNAPLSNVRKQVLAQAIVEVTTNVFTELEHRKAFVNIIAIESRFLKYAQSPTGPKGLTQVAKAAFREGLSYCGITDVSDDDVWETILNLYAGACYYRRLLDVYQDTGKAAVAYNQGPNSTHAKSYAASGDLRNEEALRYIAKFTYLTQTRP
jgi:hypothetical protein